MSTQPAAAHLVKQARRLRGVSQAEFAEEIAKTQVLVSKYESGRVQPPASVLMHCMDILGQGSTPETKALPAALEAVRLAAVQLRHALDGLVAASVSAGDTEGSHPPDSRVAAVRGSRP